MGHLGHGLIHRHDQCLWNTWMVQVFKNFYLADLYRVGLFPFYCCISMFANCTLIDIDMSWAALSVCGYLQILFRQFGAPPGNSSIPRNSSVNQNTLFRHSGQWEARWNMVQMINDSCVNAYSRTEYKEFSRTLGLHHFSEIHWSCSMSCITVITIISIIIIIIIIIRVDYWSSWAEAVSWARDRAPRSCMTTCWTSERLTSASSTPGLTGGVTTGTINILLNNGQKWNKIK